MIGLPIRWIASTTIMVGALGFATGVAAPMAGAASTPPNAATGHVTAVLPTTVSVTGTVDAEGTATTWYYQYGLATDSAYGSQTPSVSAGSGTGNVQVTAKFSGLTSATSYHFRIVATSSAGTTYGADVSVNTSAAPVVLTGAATNLTTTTATLNGVVNPEALASTWYFQYGPTTSYGQKTPTAHLAASANPTNVSAGITHLASNDSYHFRLVATSSAGTSYGTDFVLTTGLSVTLNTSASTLIYGTSVTLSGAVSSGAAGDRVTLSGERFDQAAYSGIVTVSTGNGGTWSYSVRPTVRTTYEASVTNGTSSPLVVSVAPAVSLNVVSGGRLSTRVIGEISFANHILQLQRLSAGLWVTWKHVRLGANGQVTFSTSLPKGRTEIRMAIGPFVVGIDQAAPGYIAGYSRAISYLKS
jgi:hypothetical protein